MLVANKILAANEVGGVEDNDESIDKCEKLSKTRILSKSQKSALSEKKLSKSENLPNFDAKKNGSSFLISNVKTAFNYLRLAFTKASIFDILIRNIIFGLKLMHQTMSLIVC